MQILELLLTLQEIAFLHNFVVHFSAIMVEFWFKHLGVCRRWVSWCRSKQIFSCVYTGLFSVVVNLTVRRCLGYELYCFIYLTFIFPGILNMRSTLIYKDITHQPFNWTDSSTVSEDLESENYGCGKSNRNLGNCYHVNPLRSLSVLAFRIGSKWNHQTSSVNQFRTTYVRYKMGETSWLID